MKNEINEQALLKGLASNDNRAIELIYKDNFNSIQSFIINNNGSYDDARDVFQEAIIALYEKVNNENFILTCKLNTYIYSICRRLWLKKLQHLGKYSNDIENIEETVSVENDISIHEQRDAEYTIMERAMGSLGEPCKSLLEGYYLKKLDMQTLAKQFGYTNADNAKNQKYKCLIRLKKLFFAQYNIGE